MANNNRGVETYSSSDDETVVSVMEEEEEERQNNVDPWPDLQKYLEFIGEENDKNVIYQFLACLPISKTLYVNRRSYNNLKVHYKSAHASSYATFLDYLKNVKSLTQKSHKACEKFPARTKMAGPPQKQLRLDHSFALGSFSQDKYQDKVSGNYHFRSRAGMVTGAR